MRGGDDRDRTCCDRSRKIYSLLPYHYGGISKFGWPTWARTRDNLINSQVLYQLSYRPIKTMVSVGRIELPSHGPKPRILPLNYTELFGGGDRDRTCDLLLAKQPLSQLSYTPQNWYPGRDSNSQNLASKTNTYTNSITWAKLGGLRG